MKDTVQLDIKWKQQHKQSYLLPLALVLLLRSHECS